MQERILKINIDNKEEVLKLITIRGGLLSRLKKWQDDKDVVLAAVKSFPFALEFASERLKADKEIVLAAIKLEPRVLSLAAKEIYDDDKFREIAFRVNNSAFIVDPEAFEEFVYQDKIMMVKDYHLTLNHMRNRKSSLDSSKFGNFLQLNPFYKKFERYYQPQNIPLSANEIRYFEKLLLDMKKKRLALEEKNTIF